MVTPHPCASISGVDAREAPRPRSREVSGERLDEVAEGTGWLAADLLDRVGDAVELVPRADRPEPFPQLRQVPGRPVRTTRGGPRRPGPRRTRRRAGGPCPVTPAEAPAPATPRWPRARSGSRRTPPPAGVPRPRRPTRAPAPPPSAGACAGYRRRVRLHDLPAGRTLRAAGRAGDQEGCHGQPARVSAK